MLLLVVLLPYVSLLETLLSNTEVNELINPFGTTADCSRLAGRARQATIVDANASDLEIFSAAQYVI